MITSAKQSVNTRGKQKVSLIQSILLTLSIDYDSEREACISEIQNLRAQLEEANSKCESIEQELTLARHPSNNTVSVKEEIPESVLDNCKFEY